MATTDRNTCNRLRDAAGAAFGFCLAAIFNALPPAARARFWRALLDFVGSIPGCGWAAFIPRNHFDADEVV